MASAQQSHFDAVVSAPASRGCTCCMLAEKLGVSVASTSRQRAVGGTCTGIAIRARAGDSDSYIYCYTSTSVAAKWEWTSAPRAARDPTLSHHVADASICARTSSSTRA